MRQTVHVGRQVSGNPHVLIRIGRNVLGRSHLRKQADTDPACVPLTRKGHHRDAHPHRLTRCCRSRVWIGVKRDVDLVVRHKMVAPTVDPLKQVEPIGVNTGLDERGAHRVAGRLFKK